MFYQARSKKDYKFIISDSKKKLLAKDLIESGPRIAKTYTPP
jgi:hypothetical protein